ncbi:MAG: SCO family protein [Proteobacteria bacterium]|nr:SCO family protein [Pseudomonadota bacterium]
MNIKKGLWTLFISLILISAGCSQGSDSSGKNEGHAEKMDHSQHTMPQKEIKVYENGRVIELEQEAPVIKLTDQSGKTVTNESLKGKAVLINFIYTSCDESCPIMVHKFMDIAKEMKGDLGKNLVLLSITMDPERDSVEALKTYAEKMKADTSYWSFLTGDKDVVAKTLKDFNFFYQKNEDGSFGHGNSIILLDKRGVWKYTFNVLTVPVDIAVEWIKKEI